MLLGEGVTVVDCRCGMLVDRPAGRQAGRLVRRLAGRVHGRRSSVD